uniref:Uncharacterized protein n=1 Tax=Cupriavidus pinatubonensis (strain JMP 134 / LMG 1197) TaxID=264198 RepID=Q46V15_CUPPJ
MPLPCNPRHGCSSGITSMPRALLAAMTRRLFRCAEYWTGFLDWPFSPMQKSMKTNDRAGIITLPRHGVAGHDRNRGATAQTASHRRQTMQHQQYVPVHERNARPAHGAAPTAAPLAAAHAPD